METIKKLGSFCWFYIKAFILFALFDGANKVWNGDSLMAILLWVLLTGFLIVNCLLHARPFLNWWYSEKLELWRAATIVMLVIASFKHSTASAFLIYTAIDFFIRLFVDEDVTPRTAPWWAFFVAAIPDTGVEARTTPRLVPATPAPEPEVRYVEKVVERIFEQPVKIVKKDPFLRAFSCSSAQGNCATCVSWMGPRQHHGATNIIHAEPKAVGKCLIHRSMQQAQQFCVQHSSVL